MTSRMEIRQIDNGYLLEDMVYGRIWCFTIFEELVERLKTELTA